MFFPSAKLLLNVRIYHVNHTVTSYNLYVNVKLHNIKLL